nr:hypothetical protein CDL12_30434 [Ipomoea batatas]
MLDKFFNVQGKVSTMLLLPTFRTSNKEQFIRDFGIFPSKEFLLRSNVCREQLIVKESGRWDKKWASSHIHDGISPLISLFDKSNTLRLVSFWRLSNSIISLKELEERSKSLKCGNLKKNSGNDPFRRLELKSRLSNCEVDTFTYPSTRPSNELLERSRFHNDGSENIDDGIFPPKELEERSKTLNIGNSKKYSGKDPFRRLDLKWRHSNCEVDTFTYPSTRPSNELLERSRFCNDGSENIDDGIFPPKELEERSKSLKCGNLKKNSGNDPFRRLELKSRLSNCEVDTFTYPSTRPSNELLERSRFHNDGSENIDDGIFPPKELEERSKHSNCEVDTFTYPSTRPSNELLERSRFHNDGSNNIDDGIFPPKKLEERSKTLNIGNSKKFCNDGSENIGDCIFPPKELEERSNSLKCGNLKKKSGNDPFRRLYLKSRHSNCEVDTFTYPSTRPSNELLERSRFCNDGSENIGDCIFPPKELEERSNSLKCGNLKKNSGNDPFRRLELKSRHSNCEVDAFTYSSTRPSNELLERSSFNNDGSENIDDGIFPLKELEERSKSLNFGNSMKYFGNDPLRRLELKSSVFNCVVDTFTYSSTTPSNKFLERYSSCNDGSENRDGGILPESKFDPKFMDTIFERASKWLEESGLVGPLKEKSMLVRFFEDRKCGIEPLKWLYEKST